MSYYKTMMTGNNKKKVKKVIKEKSKPKKTVLDGIKLELNEWTHKPPTEKRWSKNTTDTGLTEFEENGGKDFIKEVGAAPLYKKHIKLIDKHRDQVGREVLKFYDLLRKKGLDDAADTLLDNYKNSIIKFGKDLKQLVRKLM